MDDKNIIKIYPLEGLGIELSTIHKFSVVIGNSGSGKTYMCNKLRGLKSERYLVDNSRTNIDMDNLEIWDSSRDIDLTTSGKLIIIDRFDTIKPDEKLWKFIRESDNKFILMSYALEFSDLPYGLLYRMKDDDTKLYNEMIGHISKS